MSNKNSSRPNFSSLWGKPRTSKGLGMKLHLSFPGFHLHSIQDGESSQSRAVDRKSRDLRVTLPQMRKTIFRMQASCMRYFAFSTSVE